MAPRPSQGINKANEGHNPDTGEKSTKKGNRQLLGQATTFKKAKHRDKD